MLASGKRKSFLAILCEQASMCLSFSIFDTRRASFIMCWQPFTADDVDKKHEEKRRAFGFFVRRYLISRTAGEKKLESSINWADFYG